MMILISCFGPFGLQWTRSLLFVSSDERGMNPGGKLSMSSGSPSMDSARAAPRSSGFGQTYVQVLAFGTSSSKRRMVWRHAFLRCFS